MTSISHHPVVLFPKTTISCTPTCPFSLPYNALPLEKYCPLSLTAMSQLPSIAAHLSQTTRNQNFDGETFHKFFECWVAEQNKHLQDLVSAASTDQIADEQVQALIDRVVEHYEYYYKAKSKWVRQDVLAMLSPRWMNSLEEAFLWIGGWRPTVSFHLLYSKCGLQFEAKLNDLVQGIQTSDLAGLSAAQIGKVDELQRRTIMEEKEITKLMAKHQETVAAPSMVKLSHVASEMIRRKERGESALSDLEDKVDSSMAPKEDGLEEILQKADDLRLRTLKEVIDILSPAQAIHFLIAAAELHLRLHDWGKMMDARKENQDKSSSLTHKHLGSVTAEA